MPESSPAVLSKLPVKVTVLLLASVLFKLGLAVKVRTGSKDPYVLDCVATGVTVTSKGLISKSIRSLNIIK